MTKEEFLIKDIGENGSQSSWDWQADLRFAKFFFPEEHADIAAIIHSSTVYSSRIAAHEVLAKKTKSSRIATLRRLIKKGLIESSWMGTGEGGKNLFGVNRVRSYYLTTK